MKARSWMPLLALLLVQGCDDMLTEVPEDFLAPENFYRTAADADAAVLNAYTPLVQQPSFKARLWIGLGAGSDMSRVGPLDPNADVRASGALAGDASNLMLTHPWGQFYESINRANLAIERIPGIPMGAEHRAALLGEAKFLRALNYFYLVRLYGDVPLLTSTQQHGREIARTPAERVYRQILEDAQEAARTLPLAWDADNQGRATRGAALTLLADAYLNRQEWQKAADAARQVIDSGAHALFADYLHAFLPAYENGPEHVFFLQAEGRAAGVGSNFVAIYFPRELGRNQGGGNGSLQPSEWHYQSYLPADYRRDATYRRQWTNEQGRKFDLYPHVFKYRPTQVTDIAWGDVNIPIYRYAEVLLMYAEALNELGRSGEAVEYLNMIRARARNADGRKRAQPADYPGPLDTDALREAIYQERNWELAHEAKRWFDLKRRGVEYFMAQLAAHDPEATDLAPTDMLWPIPQDEIDLNPALIQNPGY